jgi:small-conductance mechanosensitive channel
MKLVDIKQNIQQKVPSKLKNVVVLIVLAILYYNISRTEFDYGDCNVKVLKNSTCIEKKQAMTIKSIIQQAAIAAILGVGVWQLLYLFGSDPSTMFASAGISVAIIGLSFKPLLDEYIQGTHLMMQNRVRLYDEVHIFTKWGNWYPQLHEDAVVIVELSPTFFTLKHKDGSQFTLNTAHINGFKSSTSPNTMPAKDTKDTDKQEKENSNNARQVGNVDVFTELF